MIDVSNEEQSLTVIEMAIVMLYGLELEAKACKKQDRLNGIAFERAMLYDAIKCMTHSYKW